jgi:general stress protein 26
MINRELLLNVMNHAPAVYLATVSNGRPHLCALVNLRNAELYPEQSRIARAAGFTLLLSTSAATEKVRELRENPEAAVYYCRPQSYHGVEFQGCMEILDDMQLKASLWHEDWRVYWPEGPAAADYVILRMQPAKVRGWCDTTPFVADLNNL